MADQKATEMSLEEVACTDKKTYDRCEPPSADDSCVVHAQSPLKKWRLSEMSDEFSPVVISL